MRILARIIGVAAVVFCLGATPAAASVGVSVDLGAIAVGDPLARGQRYHLPDLGVRNPGSESSRYRITVAAIKGQGPLAPSPSWFSFSPAEVTLAPGEQRKVQISMAVPRSAALGSYQAILKAEFAPNEDGSRIGAAAAARLTFRLDERSVWRSLVDGVTGFFRDHAPWSHVVAGALVLAAALVIARRRFGLEISFHRHI